MLKDLCLKYRGRKGMNKKPGERLGAGGGEEGPVAVSGVPMDS